MSFFQSLLLSFCVWTFTLVVQGAFVKDELTITWEKGAPNGQAREMIMTNGRFPGPNLVFDESDDVEITVHNRMPFNTTVHWHGLLMQDTPWSDGVPGLTQKPIEPGQSYVYKFKAYPPGQYWYHSHSRATLIDGQYGALYIRPNPASPAPWSLISSNPSDIQAMKKAAADPNMMLISDWDHFTSWEYLDAEQKTSLSIFCADSILINGKGSVYCPGTTFLNNEASAYTKYAIDPGFIDDKGCFPFVSATEGNFLGTAHPELIPQYLQSGCVASNGSTEIIKVDAADKWTSLNFISASTLKVPIFSVDEHEMWVYEVDGQYIEPKLVHTVQMFAGERYSVMIRLSQTPGDYTIRVADPGLTQIISAFATLRYQHAPRNSNHTSIGYIDYGGQNTSASVIPLNRDNLAPFPALAPSPTADAEHVLYLSRFGAAWQYTLSGSAMYASDRDAYTPLLYHPNISDALDPSLVIRTLNGSWVDLVLQVGSLATEPIEFYHMMHKHSSKTWQIGAGTGLWKYASVAEAIAAEPGTFNLANPNYRDTFITSNQGESWIVLRYQVTNPGAWLFHCHIELHLAEGMAMAILDGADKWPRIPEEYAGDRRGFEKRGAVVPRSPVVPRNGHGVR